MSCVRLTGSSCEAGLEKYTDGFVVMLLRSAGGQSYGIFQEALRNYARLVDQADGVEVWWLAAWPERDLGNPC